ncbi:MAG: hypothetical protein QJR02_01860 [Sinobacteraceae bacterium]|nr:hypothetical protein [Nevskiaceae bacterium]
MTTDTYLSAGNRLSDREKVEVIEAFFRASRNLGLRLIHHRGDADNPRHAPYLAERLDIKDESVVQQFLPRLFQYSLDLHPDTGIDPRILSVIEGSYDQLEKGALAFVGTDQ